MQQREASVLGLKMKSRAQTWARLFRW